MTNRLGALTAAIPIGVTEDDSAYNGPLSTYVEWHAATLGAGLAAAVIGAFVLFGPGAVLPFGATWLRLALYAYTGKRLTLPGGVGQLGLLKRYMSQVRSEPHYFLGASLAVFATASVALLVIGGVPVTLLASVLL